MTDLTDADKDVLDFERQQWTYPGAKETAVLEKFGVGMVPYYMRLNRIIGTDAALSYNPMLTRRLRRLRDARAEQRSARRLGFDI